MCWPRGEVVEVWDLDGKSAAEELRRYYLEQHGIEFVAMEVLERP